VNVDRPSAEIYAFPCMSASKSSATEEIGSTPVPSASGSGGEVKESPRSFLQVARRNLTEEDFGTPAARRFLIAEIERLDVICATHEIVVTRYHDQRVTIAELTQETRVSRKNDILAFVCLSLGSVGIGAAPGYLALAGGGAYGAVILCGSVLLIGAGAISKVWK
jgi:hypothetical protein